MTQKGIKTFILVFLSLVIGLQARALDLGLEGGFDAAALTATPGYGGRFAFAGGLLADVTIGKDLSVFPELLYLREGTVTSGSGSTSEIQLDYLALPLSLKMHFPLQLLRLFVFGGPQISWAINRNQKLTTGSSSTNSSLSLSYNVIDIGLQAGVGADIPVTESLSVFAHARYWLSITDASAGSLSQKNRGLLVLGGAKITL